MTFLIFIIAFITLLFTILNLLPVATPLSATFASSFTQIVASMKAWNTIFPISELLALVAFVAVFESLLLLFKFVRWVVHLARGGNSA